MAWTSASALWRSLSGRMPAIRLNALKNGLASLLFLPVLFTLPRGTEAQAVLVLSISGLIGIAAGDSFYPVPCGGSAPVEPSLLKRAGRCWQASVGSSSWGTA